MNNAHKIQKKINVVLLNTDNTDYDRYKKIRKIKDLHGVCFNKERTLKIIYSWLMDNSKYHEENDKYNGHQWRNKFINRYDKLLIEISKKNKKSKK